MQTLKDTFSEKYTEFIISLQLDRGTMPVSVDMLLLMFKNMYPDIPVTKSMLGRALSKNYFKKQIQTASGLVQCYYVNKQF